MNENVVKTEEASKHANQKVDVDVENTVDPEICKEAFKDKINENIAKTEDASKHANEKIQVDVENIVYTEIKFQMNICINPVCVQMNYSFILYSSQNYWNFTVK